MLIQGSAGDPGSSGSPGDDGPEGFKGHRGKLGPPGQKGKRVSVLVDRHFIELSIWVCEVLVCPVGLTWR